MLVRRHSVVPALIAGTTVVLGATTVVLAVTNVDRPAQLIADNGANTWLIGVAFGLLGALVLARRPGNRLGRLLGVAGLFATLDGATEEYALLSVRHGADLPLTTLAAWVGSTFWLPAFLVLLCGLPLLYPDGDLPSPRWRLPAAAALVAAVLACLGLATTQEVMADGGFRRLHNPLDLPLDDRVQLRVIAVLMLAIVALGLFAVGAILWRMRGADRDRRLQGAWFVSAVLVGGVASMLPVPDLVNFAFAVVAVGCLGVGIVRHRLFAIDVVLSRALVYALLTAVVLAAYLAVAGVLGSSTREGLVPALVAAVVALVLSGVRGRLQGWVETAMYGARRDPLTALTGLGDRLGTAMDDDEVLPAIVDVVRGTLRLPYAEVRFAGDRHAAASSGERPEHTVGFALGHAGEDVGVLEVGVRRGETRLSGTDRQLLEVFARQAGVAAHGVRATHELRRSREHVVLSREEERRRLRRELHDGVGPTLAGVSLGLEHVVKLLHRDPNQAEHLLAELRAETSGCLDEVRRIVADLRPPALDEGGLAVALHRHAALLTARSDGGLDVRVDDVALPELPPAVEVAAYRIATEAVTNTVRHASATTCRVGLAPNGEPGRPGLRLTVADDGTGRPPVVSGNGLQTMRERAEELGGTCTVTFRPGSGTLVEALLPTAAGAPA